MGVTNVINSQTTIFWGVLPFIGQLPIISIGNHEHLISYICPEQDSKGRIINLIFYSRRNLDVADKIGWYIKEINGLELNHGRNGQEP